MRLTTAIFAVVLGASTAAGAAPDVGAKTSTSGITIVSEISHTKAYPPESVRAVLGQAAELERSRPTDFGPAWYDEVAGQVVIDVANDHGEGVARAAVVARATFPYRLRRVAHSTADLDRMRAEIRALRTSHVPGGEGIYGLGVDQQANRVVVTVGSLNDTLVSLLQNRFGADSVSIRVRPEGTSRTQTGTRYIDRDPFQGGARIVDANGSACSTAFAWSGQTMLTAGHCAPNGASFNTGLPQWLGDVAGDGTRENWQAGVGTVWLPGDTEARGDMALIDLALTNDNAPFVYIGGPDSGQRRAVAGMYPRENILPGLEYCTGGHTTGELCGWKVSATDYNFYYPDDDDQDHEGEWILGAVTGYKSGQCTEGGDSGGPVYVNRADGRVDALGIHSGTQTIDFPGFPCEQFFTDIWDAYYAFPGALLTTPYAGRAVGDYDGDHKSDIGLFRPSTGQWHRQGWATVNYGQPGDLPVPADYNGDDKAEIAVFRPSTGQWYRQGWATVNFGLPGDIPVAGDYNGDGKTDIAVFRPSNGQWHRQGWPIVNFGQSGDIPVPADYDGDGDADMAVFRPSTGQWYRYGMSTISYGQSGDIPVPADYNGDGKSDLAVFRPSTGQWHRQGWTTINYGQSGDIPVPGDFDGNGVADMALFRPSTGQWCRYGMSTISYGQSGDIPGSIWMRGRS